MSATTPSERSRAPLPAEALVFVDEAYHDFCGDTIVHELGSLPNVVVGRTFAKAQGLAALRAGAIVAVPETLDRVQARDLRPTA